MATLIDRLSAQQDQRIYHITQANQATALPNIRQNSLAMSESRAALAIGKEVIVYTDPVSVPDWQGAGYVITDMDTGAGAWKIGGGLNGGYLSGLFLGVALDILILSLTVSVVAGPIGIALLAPLLAAIAVFAGIYPTVA